MHPNINISHPVENFPKSYPWYKRFGSNITYFTSQIPLWPRKNLLTSVDIDRLIRLLEKGDILLVGNFQHISGLFISGAVTHAMTYLGNKKCIHAFAHGVSYIPLRKVWRSYDTYIMLRPRWETHTQKSDFLHAIMNHIGKPYDFFFGVDSSRVESYFCTALVNESLKEAHYDTGIETLRAPENTIDTVLESTFSAHRVLQPSEMTRGRFDIVGYSDNLIWTGDDFQIIGGKISQIIPGIS